MKIVASLIEWTTRTLGPLGSLGLFILAFMESSFFPIPPDLLLIVLSLASPEKALWFALICTLGSVLGGMLGYGIGYVGKIAFVSRFFSKEKIAKVHKLFNRYEAWAIFIAGFSPIPYKIFTILGGVFYIDFRKFVIASIFSRSLRFFIEALLIMLYGQIMVDFIDKYFNLVSTIVVLAAILVYFIYRNYRKNGKPGN